MPKARPLTDGMLSILRNIADGKGAYASWCGGRSHSGGLQTALKALVKRGLITGKGELTDAGRAALGVGEVNRG